MIFEAERELGTLPLQTGVTANLLSLLFFCEKILSQWDDCMTSETTMKMTGVILFYISHRDFSLASIVFFFVIIHCILKIWC
jgi:hypothetical protein